VFLVFGCRDWEICGDAELYATPQHLSIIERRVESTRMDGQQAEMTVVVPLAPIVPKK